MFDPVLFGNDASYFRDSLQTRPEREEGGGEKRAQEAGKLTAQAGARTTPWTAQRVVSVRIKREREIRRERKREISAKGRKGELTVIATWVRSVID